MGPGNLAAFQVPFRNTPNTADYPPTAETPPVGHAKRSNPQRPHPPRNEKAAEKKQGKHKKAEKEEDRPCQQLACPFYKIRPDLHLECVHYVLKRPSDVKQHIQRVHMRSPHCPYCGVTFEGKSGEEDRDAHVNAQRCEQTDFVHCSATNEQLNAFKLRGSEKATSGSDLAKEAAQWYKIWDVLFPTERRPESPFQLPGHEERLAYQMEMFPLERFIEIHVPSGLEQQPAYELARSLFEAFRRHTQGHDLSTSQQLADQPAFMQPSRSLGGDYPTSYPSMQTTQAFPTQVTSTAPSHLTGMLSNNPTNTFNPYYYEPWSEYDLQQS
ncbi:hypothetical protein B0T25DRAFT_320784 [Lasiosphaeria hispida]|uniref:C2H2-type domain-containing protein n=1 Tax=Lasiosphaeria hispida TaxID=260671 RepID=A0AAJ0H9E1_9PEZI|nr:hypothetical protein B0T25DRAFT_320784 [Lasiosphaeria hispida]